MAYGVKPRNAEQTFALHAIMNPDMKLVSIQGVAGTGKTLLTLAGALEQRREYKPDLPGAPHCAAQQQRYRVPARRHQIETEPVYGAALG